MSFHSYLHRITYHQLGKAPNLLPNSTKHALRIPFVRYVLSLTRGNPQEVKCLKLDGPNYISQSNSLSRNSTIFNRKMKY